MTQKHSESGRSLIEIIAILVILAILLIAALLGFKALLDYLKYRQTADEVSVVATRFKVKKLQARKSASRVRVRDFYPEGTPCELNPSTCVKTPDGGHLELLSGDTDSFAVIVTDVKCVSCREIIATGAFGMIIPGAISEAAFGGDAEINGWTPQEAREHVEEICKSKEGLTDGEGQFICPGSELAAAFSLVVGSKCDSGAKYIVGGQCSYCKAGGVQVPEGKAPLDSTDGCCHTTVECGFCGGCNRSTADRNYCVDGSCVECLDNTDCPAERPYCDPRTHTCKPCEIIGEQCKDATGSGISGTYCTRDLECEKVCEDCYKPDPAVPGACILEIPLGRTPGAPCNNDSSCPQCVEPMTCELDGTYQCKCPPTNYEGARCNAICPCGKDADDVQLTCQDGICRKPADCSAYPEPRYLGSACVPNDCPCSTSVPMILQCRMGICQCGPQPIHPSDPCWGKCGCGVGLSCSTDGLDEEGICLCEELHMGDSCTTNDHGPTDCPCTNDKVGDEYVMICDNTKHCACNPKIPEHSLDAGSPCEEDCNQCKEGLECHNGKCGCEKDSDCDQCGGEECDEATKTCVCANIFNRDPTTGKCVCKEGATLVPWFIMDNGPHKCCAPGKVPYLYNGEYICVPVCGPEGIKQVAILLDYSHSLKMKDPEYKVQGTAKKIMAALDKFNRNLSDSHKISVPVAREDLDHCEQGAAQCESSVDSNRQVTGGPSNQKLCACNKIFTKRNGKTQRGGTSFDSAINGISDKNHTFAILISDGKVRDTSFDGKGFPKVIAIDDGGDVNWGEFGHYVFENFEESTFGDLIAREIIDSLCIPPEEVTRLIPDVYCPGRDDWNS